jgi:hypothetical protein
LSFGAAPSFLQKDKILPPNMSELTYQDVAEHNTKKDIYMVIHDKIYDASKFIDEHPYVSSPDPDSQSLRSNTNVEPGLLETSFSSPIY